MSIMTKRGDDGTTSLWSGERVRKDDLRVEAYGTVDELGAHLAEALHAVSSEDVKQALRWVGDCLFIVGGELATASGPLRKAIGQPDLVRLESLAGDFERRLGLKGFVQQGGTPASAKLDVARTVCRRAERRILSLAREAGVSPLLLSWMNRLSDLLFLAGRIEEAAEGKLRYYGAE